MAEEIDEKIKENLNEEIEEDENISTPHIWKISHGSKSSTQLSDEERNELREKHLVAIGHVEGKKQYKKFKSEDQAAGEIHEGDYFYLCNDGDVTFRLLGQFTTPKAEDCDLKSGWLARQYRIIASAKKDDEEYQKPLQEYFDQKSKGWTPNTHGNTIYRVRKKEEEAFEDIILKPYFGITLDELYSGKNFEETQKENFREWLSAQKKRNGEKYGSKTVNSYVSHINTDYERFQKLDGYTSLFQVQLPDLIDQFEKKISNSDEFKDYNNDKKNTAYSYTNGMKNYAEFLRNKNKESINDQKETENVISPELEDNTTILISDANDMNMTAEELGKILGNMYNSVADEGLMVAAIHTFGIKYGKIILEKSYSVSEIIRLSGINGSYHTELSKALNTYKCLASNKFGISIVEKDSDQFQKNLSVNEEENQIRENESGHVTIDDSTYQTFKNKDNDIKNYSHNRIFFGAPGTGKSYQLNKDRESLLGENNETDYERVTFHPDYSYANFVGTYKPVNDENGEIKYEYVPGPFMRTFVKAMKNAIEVQDEVEDPKPHLLIIEEINRADVAAVFGDIFQLLDRKDNVSEYPIETSEDMRKYLSKELNVNLSDCEKIKIPDNMFIWATMNSADQGVFPMDTAFKRRWDFTYIGIDDKQNEINKFNIKLKLKDGSIQTFKWNDLRKAINDFLANNNINEDKQLGPYFISTDVLGREKGEDYNTKFSAVFKDKVIMYLFEDAAKQRRSNLFKKTRYSEICAAFDEGGIFGAFKEYKDITNGIDVDVKTYPSPSDENSEEGEGGRQASTTETTDNSDVNQD